MAEKEHREDDDVHHLGSYHKKQKIAREGQEGIDNLNIIKLAYVGKEYDIDIANISDLELRAIKHGIIHNTKFACWIFELFKHNDIYKLCGYCVSKFISVDYVDYKLIEKYSPVYFNFPGVFSREVYEDLSEKYKYLKYAMKIGGASSNTHCIDEPEINMFKFAAKKNKRMYDEILEQAQKLGYFKKYYDMNGQITDETSK